MESCGSIRRTHSPSLGECYSLRAGAWKDFLENIEVKQILKDKEEVLSLRFYPDRREGWSYDENNRCRKIE